MQAVPASWRVAGYSPVPTSVESQALHKKFSGSRQRCQRCDIPLGLYGCPNPKCQEQHGECIGNLCSWCYEQQERQASHGLIQLPDTLLPTATPMP